MRATGNGEHPVHLLGVLDHAHGVVLAQIDVDGGLIGGAALKPESFLGIVNAAV